MSINTNTVISVVVALILFYIFIKIAQSIIKFVIFIVMILIICFGIQSLGIYDIPVVSNVYPTISKMIPSKQIWTSYSKYKNDLDKAIKSKVN